MEARVVRELRSIPAAEWDALVGDDGSPFLEHAWLVSLEDAACVGGATGWVPLHVTLYENDRLVAASPVYAKSNSEGEFVFDWSWADLADKLGFTYYPKLVVGVPFTPVTGSRVLVAKGEDRRVMTARMAEAVRVLVKAIDASSAHVLFPDEDEANVWCDHGFMHRVGFQFQWANDGYRSMNDFLARFNAKKRHALKREMAQPAKDGVTIETLAPAQIDASLVSTFYELYTSTVDRYFYGRRYLTPRFFELVVDRFRDRLAWVTAKKEGAIIAGAFNVQKGKRLYGRYWGAREGGDLPFLHFNVCYYHGIARCIEQGLERFEPGAGGEHKYARGFLPTLTHSAHYIAAPRLAAPLRSFLARERDAVMRHVDEERRESPIALRGEAGALTKP